MPPGSQRSSAAVPAHCRACGVEVTTADLVCPACKAPRPAQAEFHGEGYEWRTRLTWMGYPLIHIAFGLDATGRPRVARGLVAIGQRAAGLVAIGIFATGFIAIGLVAIGLLSLGVVAVAALAAIGVNAIAPIAYGVAAIGLTAGGLAPFGWRILR